MPAHAFRIWQIGLPQRQILAVSIAINAVVFDIIPVSARPISVNGHRSGGWNAADLIGVTRGCRGTVIDGEVLTVGIDHNSRARIAHRSGSRRFRCKAVDLAPHLAPVCFGIELVIIRGSGGQIAEIIPDVERIFVVGDPIIGFPIG